jgi:hypothetical protein
MIRKNEFRPGNWFRCQDHYYRFESFDNGPIFKQIEGTEADKAISIEDFKPIRLTKKLVLKCGFMPFDKSGENFYVHHTEFDLKWQEDEVYIDCISIPHIKYLHQLQNLYFAFSGKEMKIDLKS